MARFLLAAMPFTGHVNPMLALASELVRRGHDVRFYTGRAFTAKVVAAGARPVTWGQASDFDEHDLSATFPRLLGKRGMRQVFTNLTDLFIGTAPGQLADLEAEYTRAHWDVLVSEETCVGAALYTQKHDCPWATTCIAPLSLPSKQGPPSGLGLVPGENPVSRARDAMLRALTPVLSMPLDSALRKARHDVGLSTDASPFHSVGYSPALVLAAGVASLDFDRTDRPASVTWVGRLAPLHPRGDLPSWWDELDGRRVVHVTQGTQNLNPSDLIRPAISALAARDVLIVVTTGTAGTDELPFPVPLNVRVAGFIPHDALLPRVDLFITNGGWGGVLAALAHGVPLIVAGGDLDKPEIASRVSFSGAGISLRTGTPRPRALACAYDRVMGKAHYRLAAERIGHELAAAGGAGRAAQRLEEFAASS